MCRSDKCTLGFCIGGKHIPKYYDLTVKFYVASKKTDEKVKKTLTAQVADAERFFKTKPALRIKWTHERVEKVGGKDLTELRFESNSELKNFMDTHFDHVALTETRGHMTILVADKISYEKRDGTRRGLDGRAYFPHFSRRLGILLKTGSVSWVLAHELGHTMGLVHTWDTYFSPDPKNWCNQDYRPKALSSKEGQGNSCTKPIDREKKGCTCNGSANLMDYCNDSAPRYLNPCQKKLAAGARIAMLNKYGKVNYKKMKGMFGKPSCGNHGDCRSSEYCHKALIPGVGDSTCKRKRKNGSLCRSPGVCKSGKCKLGFCAK
jgi:hypothetical protein